MTTRLAGSLPQSEKIRLAEQYKLKRKQISARIDHTSDELDHLSKRCFLQYERLLDKADHGLRWLANTAVAEVIIDSLRHWDNEAYDLIAYMIMSNHIHIAFSLFDNESQKQTTSLMRLMQSIKSFTARKCNQILTRKGPFWADKSYDRLVRDRNELHRIVQYILQNPVNAGLCEHWQEWKWTYIKPEYNDFE